MRKDAADALNYGCTGLLGIHWRTRILGPNVSALAQAAWDQSGWSDEPEQTQTAPPAQPPEGAQGGKLAQFPTSAISDADNQAIYQTVRYDVQAYHIDVPNGVYDVKLKLCEPAYRDAGRRVFGAKVQDRVLFEHLDIMAKVGKDRALDFTAKSIKVNDGRLAVQFLYEIEFPCVAGIVIQGMTDETNQFPGQPFERKINCGGPAYSDYEADLPTIAGSGRSRFLPAADFYRDWATTQFGSEVAEPIAALFTRLDGHLPRPADWVTGPGSIRPDTRPWSRVQTEYTFVDELAALRSQIAGPGNLERFDYWLNNFRYLRNRQRELLLGPLQRGPRQDRR